MNIAVFDKLLTATPINKLAAIVTGGGGSAIQAPVFEDVPTWILKQRAKAMQNETGLKRSPCLHAVARAAGYDSWHHYVDVLQSRGEYRNSADMNARKKAKAAAKHHAKEHIERLEVEK